MRPSQTIVLIHGLWVTPKSWRSFQSRYENLGHDVIAERGWEEVADYALHWTLSHSTQTRTIIPTLSPA